MSQVGIRYIVTDIDAAVDFYTRHLGFELEMQAGKGFAALNRGGLRLLLSAPGTGGAGQSTGGQAPQPGGWNRFQIAVEDLAARVEVLQAQGLRFRGEIVSGKGGRQILLEDPSGNVVELFEPVEH